MLNSFTSGQAYNYSDYKVPENFKYSLSNEIEGVKTMVKINAEIIIPEHTLSIVSVQPTDISYDTVDGMLNLIQNNRLLYDSDTCAMVTFKSDVQKRIDHYEYELSMVAEGDETSASFYREQLKELYVELEKAPSTIDEANEMLASGEIVYNKIVNGNFLLPGEGETI